MLKIYMNEPFATSHELAQAKRLVQLLNKSSDNQHMWLCLNFNLGGKAMDGALITKNSFVILELKAVGGDVDCGPAMENSSWGWREDPLSALQEIRTAPYANPFSQIKSYRTAAIGEFEHRQRGFLGKVTLLKENFNFAWWVKGCVLLSKRDAQDVSVSAGQPSPGTVKWFCCCTLGALEESLKGLCRTVSLGEKEVERLIEKVLGLKRVDAVLESFVQEPLDEEELGATRTGTPAMQDNSPLASFMKRYGKAPATVSPKVEKTVAKPADSVTHVVNDFSEIDALFSSAVNPVVSPCAASTDRNVKAGVPMNCNYLRMTLQGEIDRFVADCGKVSEYEGQDAVALVIRDFPQQSNFEVSKVLRFGDSVSATDGVAIIQYLAEKYGPTPQWSAVTNAQGGIEFVFGKVIETKPKQDKPEEGPYERPIGTRFLMPRWVREKIENESEGLSPLSVQEVQLTSCLSADDVRRYAKTYFPRSCAEAFVVSDWLMGNNTTPSQVSVLDVGCGCGGASLGCLLALHKHCETGKSKISIVGIDNNSHSLEFAKTLFENARSHFRGHDLDFRAMQVELKEGWSHDASYDVVIASKSIGELALTQGPDAYVSSVQLCAERMSDHGMLILIDLPKHRSAMEKAVDGLAANGLEGWIKSLSIALDGTSDSEEYVCACLTKGPSKEIRKE